jgi:wyosine [tRNA(Phe)-imidazoG37] synthetase (radical SAM superfamily)
MARKEYVDEKDILAEVRAFFKNKPNDLKVDCITFSGSGEPTLNSRLGRLIKGVRRITGIPVVLITNSSLLVEPEVRRQAAGVDLIIPSLDAVTQDVFEEIDRPVKGSKVSKIIDSLIEFKKIFKGRMWLEIMLVRGINDKESYLKKVKKVVDKIKPDRVQINSPVRPPAEKWVKPPSVATLKKTKQIFGENCDIV